MKRMSGALRETSRSQKGSTSDAAPANGSTEPWQTEACMARTAVQKRDTHISAYMKVRCACFPEIWASVCSSSGVGPQKPQCRSFVCILSNSHLEEHADYYPTFRCSTKIHRVSFLF